MTASYPPPPAPAGTAPAPRHERWWGLGLLAMVTLAAHGRTLANGFIWDDVHTVVENPALASLRGLWSSFLSEDWSAYGLRNRGLYRPLATACLWVERQLLGAGAAGHHAVSLALHCAAAWLLLRALRAAGVRFGIALGAAACFAAHPIVTEGAQWISARPDQLVTVLFVAAVLAALSGRALLAAAAGALACFAKEPGIAVLAAALVAVAGRVAPRRLAAAAGLAAAGLVAYLALRAQAGAGASAPTWLREGWPVLAAAGATFGAALVGFAEAVAFPLPLDAVRPFPALGIGVGLAALALGLLALAVLGVRAWRRRDGLPAAVAVAILGSLGLVALYGVGLSERYLYLPTLALALGGGLAAETAWRRLGERAVLAGRAAAGTTALLELLGVAASASRAAAWGDPVLLFSSAVEAHPANPDGHQFLGGALYAAGRRSEAAAAFERAADLGSTRAALWSNLCALRREDRRLPEAAAACARALAMDAGDPRARYHLALVLLDQGRASDARAELAETLRRTPGYAPARRLAAQLGPADPAPTPRVSPAGGP